MKCFTPCFAYLQERSPVISEMNGMVKPQITSEHIPAGQGMPSWLFEAFRGEDPGLLVVHPNEHHRQQTLVHLHEQGFTHAPQAHTTLNQLWRLLHVDFRLPVMINDDVTSFMALHRRCSAAAEEHGFPLLHTPGAGTWTVQKTKRLLSLHAAVSGLRSPFAWSSNPGVDVLHDLMLSYEQEVGGTLPMLLQHHVLNAMKQAEHTPFHFAGLNGIVLLDAAPDFTEVEQDLLIHLSAHCPVHQLVHPGSFRLGHHGAYVLDEPPCTEANLPTWLPPHEVWTSDGTAWSTPVGKGRGTVRTRIALDAAEDVLPATASLLGDFLTHERGRALVVDGQAHQRRASWHRWLKQWGVVVPSRTRLMHEQPVHAAIVHAASIGQGMNAWSLEGLRTLVTSTALPWSNDMYPNLEHPSHPTWRPTPHLDVLEDIGQHFHVLGGPGAMARWMGALRQARPSLLERHPEERRQRLEETQWWLACLLTGWAPLLMPEDRHHLGRHHVGCSSGHVLPTPKAPANGLEWLGQTVDRLDIARMDRIDGRYNRGWGDLQDLLDAMERVVQQEGADMLQGQGMIDVLNMVGESLRIPSTEPQSPHVQVLTPEEAHGCEADLVVLAGLDVQSWPMKRPTLPWLDATAQLELGMFHNDVLVRQGRHHLRHLLNAGRYVVVMDTSPVEDNGPSAPLAEWLTDVRRSRAWDAMRQPPPYLLPSRYQGDGVERRWTWTVREQGHGAWLCPLSERAADLAQHAAGFDLGLLPREGRQRAGHRVLSGLGEDEHALLHPMGVVRAQVPAVQEDRYRRQPMAKRLEEGEWLPWEARAHLLSADALRFGIGELNHLKTPSAGAPAWPHLGHRPGRTHSISVDPRPLPPYAGAPASLIDRFGHLSTPLVRTRWSPSRIEAVLRCPQRAWSEVWLDVSGDGEPPSEDIDNRTRGQLMHDVSVALLEAHGLKVSKVGAETAQPLHLGVLETVTNAWGTVLNHLAEHATWLGRSNAVSVHRTRALLDASPDAWAGHVEGDAPLPLGGQVGSMLEATWALRHAAPLVAEWPASNTDGSPVRIDAPSDDDAPSGFLMSGFADRIDEVHLTEGQRARLIDAGVLGDASHDAPFPLNGVQRPVQRLVIVRDLKTVNGPKADRMGLRHARCMFEDLQLALYARAWEQTHPNDRVIGVGASEIGERTVHYVELDEALDEIADELHVGQLTQHLRLHFPTSNPDEPGQTSFRRWMEERLRTAQRAITAFGAGHINPTPGRHCNHCAVRDGCDVATLGGDAR